MIEDGYVRYSDVCLFSKKRNCMLISLTCDLNVCVKVKLFLRDEGLTWVDCIYLGFVGQRVSGSYCVTNQHLEPVAMVNKSNLLDNRSFSPSRRPSCSSDRRYSYLWRPWTATQVHEKFVTREFHMVRQWVGLVQGFDSKKCLSRAGVDGAK